MRKAQTTVLKRGAIAKAAGKSTIVKQGPEGKEVKNRVGDTKKLSDFRA